MTFFPTIGTILWHGTICDIVTTFLASRTPGLVRTSGLYVTVASTVGAEAWFGTVCQLVTAYLASGTPRWILTLM